MSLLDILPPERTALLDVADGDALLEAVAGLLSPLSSEQSEIAASLRQRERLGRTAIGHGVALPHGRNGVFGEARGAFVRLARPVDYGALDGEPVDLVFALSVPSGFTHQHLQLLAGIAERLADPALRDALRAAPDAATLHALLTRQG